MKKILFVILFNILFVTVFSQSVINTGKKKIYIPPTICHASDKTEKIYIPPPREFLLKSFEKKSDIIVTYSLFPNDAKAAFEYAVSIWESIIESPIPIYVQANWRTQDNGILGSASPTEYVSNFENAPHKDRFYPIAVAEKIAGSDINPTSLPDISCTFNKSVQWYFGTDGETPDQLYDFATVVLHELGHGLGFTGFFYVIGNQGYYEYDEIGEASAFDYLVVNTGNDFLVDKDIFNVPSTKLYNALVSNALFSKSQAAVFDNSGNRPRLYAPGKFDDGSSIYHLNDATYPANSGNSLMTHAIGKGEAVHDPGPITTGILADIGWNNMYLNLDKPKDTEEKKPIVFNLNVKSDYGLDTTSLYLYYSYNEFINQIDSIQFIIDLDGENFSATLNPDFDLGEIQYYISARDNKNRNFYIPSEAPSEIYSVKIGPDTESPEILHDSIPYFVLTNKNLPISTFADDNLGIDTVYVQYTINGVEQSSFGLKPDSLSTYSAFFNFDLNNLNDGDEISYRIVAIDSSLAKNRTSMPTERPYTFKVEKIFDPVISYFNTFDSPTPDFIIYDFDIYTEPGFDNAALQSPHPYPSPNKNNTNWDFSTILKYPIILQENASMSFDEIVLVEPGEILAGFGDDDFWDYVIVEASKDTGKTWLQLADGYDSGAYTVWEDNYNMNIVNQASNTTPIPEWYITREINMLANRNFIAGDTVIIRFRLFSDPYANGWGWTVDNLRIQQSVSSPLITETSKNIIVYPNPVKDILNITILSENKSGELIFDISNMHGQKLISTKKMDSFNKMESEIDLSELVPGMYVFTIKEKGIPVYTKKIIKN